MPVPEWFFDRRAPRRVVTPVVGVSRTKQEFVAESDIHTIMRRYRETGFAPLAAGDPFFADVSGASSGYLDAMLRVRRMEEWFAELPAEIRAHVRNRPEELLDLVTDPLRLKEAQELGLLDAPGEVAGVPEPKEVKPAVAGGE